MPFRKMASPTVVKLVPMTILTVQVAVTPVVDAVKTLKLKFGLVSTLIAVVKGEWEEKSFLLPNFFVKFSLEVASR
jgi:hypothetical protein